MKNIFYAGLLKSELLLILMFISTCLLLFYFKIEPLAAWQLYREQLLVSLAGYVFALFVSYLVLLTIAGLQHRRQKIRLNEKEFWNKFRSNYLSLRSILRDLRLVNVIMLTFVFFAYLKHLIPFVNSALYDQQLLQMEKSIFAGRLATDWIIDFFGIEARQWLSAAYTTFYVYLPVVCFILILQRNSKLADQYCSAFVLCWFLGVLWVYLYPTWGPCFFKPDSISLIPADTEVARLQRILWRWKLALEYGSAKTDGLFAISGVPSLHMAIAILGSLYLRRINLWLAVLSWVFVVCTFCSTIYFGWHYVADHLAAVVLVAICTYLARLYVSSEQLEPRT